MVRLIWRTLISVTKFLLFVSKSSTFIVVGPEIHCSSPDPLKESPECLFLPFPLPISSDRGHEILLRLKSPGFLILQNVFIVFIMLAWLGSSRFSTL